MKSNQTYFHNQFINFTFFRIDPNFRRLPVEEQKQRKKEFKKIFETYYNHSDLTLSTYSLLGLRADSDFMIWRIADNMEIFQEMTSRLLYSGLGQYLITSHSFLSTTKKSVYVEKNEHSSNVKLMPAKSKYLFVYPFIKTRDWYQTSFQERKEIMDEHINVGKKYPTIKLNTTYSFGIDDQEFVVAFETDDALAFSNLVQDLRETKASLYTMRDTPMFTCIHQDISDLLSII